MTLYIQIIRNYGFELFIKYCDS